MRIAHIIITHKNPSQLERILRKMQHPQFDFYIHVDKKVDIEDFRYLTEISGVKLIKNRLNCNWGGYSTLQAMVSSLKEVILSGVNYGFYNLLSGQDYPLKTNEEIYSFLTQNAGKSFIYYETENTEWWDNAVHRFQRYHLTDFNFKGKTFIEGLINKLLPIRKFPFAMKLYGGCKSSWWTLNKEGAIYVATFFVNETRMNKFLKFCWGTDEFIIPTILLNSPLKDNIINDNLRYIEFPEGMANPKILGVEDMEKMRSSNMLFARKFDTAISSDVLDALDASMPSLISKVPTGKR
ncbi:Core-2/I-Branching enzyme [Pedobacter westerhofensis]|uniref:Peptide O-xylosyltransferase n=1 Tax=Pedobacter westerhofensis TaxID=425512 RepID=A0A521E6J2_9SPHI|nr:beta-1,6-N-acetylglucosaminyltransferase [Pedobacter westerhofensis]SMO79563.1 Core-2/I-Branching enzyme [Pedobacter westerhofensis]